MQGNEEARATARIAPPLYKIVAYHEGLTICSNVCIIFEAIGRSDNFQVIKE
jgi:hypothetical protein